MSKVLIKNIQTLWQVGEDRPRMLKGKEMDEVPHINNAFLAIEDRQIVAYGPMSEWEGITDWRGVEVVDAEGKHVMPAFCDSHTHTVFAKSREEEFVDRIHGLSYEEIALKGGGILNSAKKLAEMDEEQLFIESKNRVEQLMSYGTGAIEIKSGYGLSYDAELKMLRVIKRLKETLPITIKATFLGAHAFPVEYKTNHKAYINLLIEELLPIIEKEKLADYIDIFCERNYFSIDEMDQILKAGQKYGLRPKVHVNQFSVMGGVAKAIEYNALSVDHLEEMGDEDILALKGSECMPVFLPSCSHFLSIPFGDAKRLLTNDLPFALASDFNPGSTPSGNLGFVWSLACVKMKLTPFQALNALTLNAAYAMGLEQSHGRIALGYSGPVIMTKEIPSLAYIPYAFGDMHVERMIF